MNTIDTLKDIVYNQGLSTLLQRMEALIDERTLKKLCTSVIISAEIVDMDAVIAKIKEKWTIFNIIDVEVNFKSQTIDFRIWGGPYWINKKYSSYRIFDGEWSESETEEFNYQRTTKEEYAEENSFTRLSASGTARRILSAQFCFFFFLSVLFWNRSFTAPCTNCMQFVSGAVLLASLASAHI